MALDGVLTRDFDVESPVDKFFKAFLEISNLPVEDNGNDLSSLHKISFNSYRLFIKQNVITLFHQSDGRGYYG